MMVLQTDRRRVRVIHYSPWADRLEEAAAFLKRVSEVDVSQRMNGAGDENLKRMARLDCDWHAECCRAFSSLAHPGLEFLEAHVVGRPGLADLAGKKPPVGEEWWLVFMGQHPQALAGLADKLLGLFARNGVRIAYYGFDEPSRTMPCFAEVAPHLDVFIHDELPLSDTAIRLLSPHCLRIHRSWVASLLPFGTPFNELAEDKILFLGSGMGLTPQRRREIAFLQERFQDRFIAIHDHSVSVSERAKLGRYKVSLCPEGRKFGTPAMSKTHTDRPFWSGCLGMVPVSENSRTGDRLTDLHAAGLIERYGWGNLDSLASACERALSKTTEDRRKIYDHFNRHETVSHVFADALFQANRQAGLSSVLASGF